jgi:hypothetical protein
MKKISTNEVRSRLPDFIKLDENTYSNTNTKCRFVDSEYGEFWALPCDVFQGHGHKARGIKENVTQRTLNPVIVQSRLQSHISLDVSTYVSTHVKCRFVDSEYGEFWARPSHVMRGSDHPQRTREKTTQSYLKKYGVDHNMRDPGVALEVAKKHKKSIVLHHWKTGQELICTASYEIATVRWLNAKQVDYQWQSCIFKLPSGTSYRPDLFLVNEKMWIEIKGWKRPQSMLKWAEFQSIYRNSEMWDESYLKSKGIL